MDDLISRRAAIEALDTLAESYADDTEDDYFTGCYSGVNRSIDAIKALPTAQPEPHWIPVTERLPETDDEVLTTYIVNGNKNKRYVETSTYYDGDEGHWSSPWDEYRVAGTRIEVLAWMPLPEPYKEVTE